MDDDHRPANTFTAKSGRVWRWREVAGKSFTYAPVGPPPGGRMFWIRDVDGLAGVSVRHPEGLEGVDRDYPPLDTPDENNRWKDDGTTR